MKLILNSIVFLLLVSHVVLGEEINKNYEVRVGGIKIGELSWQIETNGDTYLNRINLKSKGLLSAIYSFKGEYSSEGLVYKNKLLPQKYNHLWKTKKTIKQMDLIFENNKLASLSQTPIEKEKIRVDIFGVQNTNDPLTSFLKIMMGEKKTLVVDGRRLYTMSALNIENKDETIIEISNYFNLWADHKRNKFEKITFEKKLEEFLPSKMHIHFDGKVFKLEQN